jgi:hypothetical protein
VAVVVVAAIPSKLFSCVLNPSRGHRFLRCYLAILLRGQNERTSFDREPEAIKLGHKVAIRNENFGLTVCRVESHQVRGQTAILERHLGETVTATSRDQPIINPGLVPPDGRREQ